MNKWRLVLIILIVCFFTVSSSEFQEPKGNLVSPNAKNGLKSANIKIEEDYGKIPLTFIPNQGQIDKKVYYYIQGKDKTVYFTSNGLTYSLAGPMESKPGAGEKSNPRSFEEQRERELSLPSKRWVVKLDFVGAKKDVKPELLEKSGTLISYFKGKTEDWQTGLQAAAKIIYRELWQGIDLVYYGTVNKMKYEFIVHPGADPSQIKLAYRGAESVKENSQGQLEVQTPVGGFFDDTPAAWQVIAGKRENVSLKYTVESGKEKQDTPDVTYGFSVGKYDKNQTLILDPVVIVYCGYIGGSLQENYAYIALDASGCVYITGYTESSDTNFPLAVGPNLTYNGGGDTYVAKVSQDGTSLVYCGYIGGSKKDFGNGIAVDSSGCAYVNGYTESSETTFPVTVGPDLTFNGGLCDSFAAKISADGAGLVYCGYIGGSGYDNCYGIAVDGSGCAYISGFTESDETSFPVQVGPDVTHNGNRDFFVAKVKSDGTALDYCGYIGGSEEDRDGGIAVDALGCAYVIGYTYSTETTFPVIEGPDLTYNGGSYDVFVAKIKANGTGLQYCGYIGGSSGDYGEEIAIDGSGCAYITGATKSTETTFPVAVGPDLTYNGGDYDAFVAKVKADGAGLVYCGYVGGSYFDGGCGIAVDGSGCAYVSGYTYSTETSFPVTVGPDLNHNGGDSDGFVAKVKAEGTTLDYCGYIGGSSYDLCYEIAVDGYGCAYVGGTTLSTEATFPVINGPDLTYNGGTYDAFVAKISSNTRYTVNFAAGNGGTLTGITTQTVLAGSDCTAIEAVPNTGYQFVNWTGTGGFVTTASNPLTVTNVTADMTITAHFLLSNPAGWTPSENLQYNMIVYGKAYNGNNPAALGDWIAAFGPGGASDCRGAAAVQANGNYMLIAGSNVTSGEVISFKLWPLPSGPSLDSSENVDFIDNNVYNGLSLHFGHRGQNIALVNGWNWISFNVLPDDTSLNSVFAGLNGVIEQVKTQSQAALYSGGNWIGDLTDMSDIANGFMYKVKTNQDCVVTVNGSTIPFNHPLSLITGWNWTAYIPSLLQPLEDAIDSIMTPVSQIKSQYRAVIKIGSSLYGDLTVMEPNKGYIILMNTPGTLIYPYGVVVFPDQRSKKSAAVNMNDIPFFSWPLIKGNQYNMIAYGKVYFEGKPVNKSGDYLAGIGPNGEKDGRFLSPVKTDGSYFATILGNANGETIKFKLINSANGRIYDMADSLKFQTDSIKTAFDLKAQSIKVTSPNGGETWNPKRSYDITWRSGGIDNVRIELYKGTILKKVICASTPAGTGKYTWTIPTDFPQGTKYKIKISSVDAGLNLSDAGNDYFTIAGSSATDVTVL